MHRIKWYSSYQLSCLLVFTVTGRSDVANDVPDDTIGTGGCVSFPPHFSLAITQAEKTLAMDYVR